MTSGDGRDIIGGGHGVSSGSAGAIRADLDRLPGTDRVQRRALGLRPRPYPAGAWCEDAWIATAMLTEVTERRIEHVDEAIIHQVQEGLARSDSEGQRGRRRCMEGPRSVWGWPPTPGPAWDWPWAPPAPLWSEVTAKIADRIEEYAALGIDEFALSGYPHLEEAHWFGDGVLPIIERRGRRRHRRRAAGGSGCDGAVDRHQRRGPGSVPLAWSAASESRFPTLRPGRRAGGEPDRDGTDDPEPGLRARGRRPG